MAIAVAFFAGFNNNNAYERLWDARKIWGEILNSGRSWGSSVRAYVGNRFTTEDLDNEELIRIHKRIIYRHIGWLYALRKQLLVPAPWEHFEQGGIVAQSVKRKMNFYGIDISVNGAEKEDLNDHLHEDEIDHVLKYVNTATHIIDKQSQELKRKKFN
jgi:putative membrane protein